MVEKTSIFTGERILPVLVLPPRLELVLLAVIDVQRLDPALGELDLGQMDEVEGRVSFTLENFEVAGDRGASEL